MRQLEARTEEINVINKEIQPQIKRKEPLEAPVWMTQTVLLSDRSEKIARGKKYTELG